MLAAELTDSIASVRGVGPVLAGRLARLGIERIRDLLLLLPRAYEDRREITALARAETGQKVAVDVTVAATAEFGRGRARTVRAQVSDGATVAYLVAFGRPFLRSALRPGRRFLVWGSFRRRGRALESTDFELEPWSEHPSSFGRMLPVYPLTEGLSQASLRRLVASVLEAVAPGIEDGLPPGLRAARSLPAASEALRSVHFPRSAEEAEVARRSLAFEELLVFELAILRRRPARAAVRSPRPIDRSMRDALLARLPFSLTPGQREAMGSIEEDLAATVPMARLLQGDVGCGKTLVALLSAAVVIRAGEQVAVAAPTELLARQHAENAARLLEPAGARVALLSGAVTGEPRRLLLAALAAGEIDVLFGTHALFSAEVVYRRLGLVIVDEQHRFGVLQRAALLAKGSAPDLLLMTATPIPRTLALTAFGDLDVTTIRTMPPGRLPVATHLAREGNEEKVYRRVRAELERGRQAYFVYPLIEGSEALAAKDAETAFARLRDEVYPGFGIGLIHSRLPEEAKERTMAEFAAGRLRILVATSVVEVGVDVAAATCMVVEHAERFGLSTLHQLRGRVGRGPDQSYAFLVYGSALTPEGIERLRIMKETTDGFAIAERDLALRGPGELLGVRQSGYLRFRAADLTRDGALLLQAREEAMAILKSDPGLVAASHGGLSRLLACQPDAGAEGG